MKSFSKVVLESHAEEISAVVCNFAESQRAAEAARRAVEKFTKNLTKVQKGLSKAEKGLTPIRKGFKTLNPKSFRQFVLDSLANGEKTLDQITASARGANYVSSSKTTLRSSLHRACMVLAKDKLVKSLGNATFKLAR
jgi:hypothetical protein